MYAHTSVHGGKQTLASAQTIPAPLRSTGSLILPSHVVASPHGPPPPLVSYGPPISASASAPRYIDSEFAASSADADAAVSEDAPLLLVPPGSVAAAVPRWARDRLGVPLSLSDDATTARALHGDVHSPLFAEMSSDSPFPSHVPHASCAPAVLLPAHPSTFAARLAMPAQRVAPGLRQVHASRLLRLRRDIAPLLDRAAAAGAAGGARHFPVPDAGAVPTRAPGPRAAGPQCDPPSAAAADSAGLSSGPSLPLSARANTAHLLAAAAAAAAAGGLPQYRHGVRYAATGRRRRAVAGARVAALAAEAVWERAGPGATPAAAEASIVFPIDWASSPVSEVALGRGPATAMSALYGPDVAASSGAPAGSRTRTVRCKPPSELFLASASPSTGAGGRDSYAPPPLEGPGAGGRWLADLMAAAREARGGLQLTADADADTDAGAGTARVLQQQSHPLARFPVQRPGAQRCGEHDLSRAAPNDAAVRALRGPSQATPALEAVQAAALARLLTAQGAGVRGSGADAAARGGGRARGGRRIAMASVGVALPHASLSAVLPVKHAHQHAHGSDGSSARAHVTGSQPASSSSFSSSSSSSALAGVDTGAPLITGLFGATAEEDDALLASLLEPAPGQLSEEAALTLASTSAAATGPTSLRRNHTRAPPLVALAAPTAPLGVARTPPALYVPAGSAGLLAALPAPEPALALASPSRMRARGAFAGAHRAELARREIVAAAQAEADARARKQAAIARSAGFGSH